MLKIMYRVPQAVDAVSLYRGIGPLSQLRKTVDVDFITDNEFNWAKLAWCDLLYMVRPSTDADKRLLEMAKRYRKPVWIDYDDNILAVPLSNPAHTFYENTAVKSNIAFCLAEADAVSVSTQFLADSFNPYRDPKKPCSVIPNAFPDHLIDFDMKLPEKRKVITWRGSRTHDEDLAIAHLFFIEAQRVLPDWQFVFLGEPDHKTIKLFTKDRIKVIPSMDCIDYFHKLNATGSSIHAVPLEDNVFNRSKSNLAWIEASFAGAMTLGPGVSMSEWDRPGLYNGHWPNIFSMIEDPKIIQAFAVESRNYIRENLLLSKVNPMRAELIYKYV